MVLISTDKAVRPCNVMGASKRFAELIVQNFAKSESFEKQEINSNHTCFSIVRFGNVLNSSVLFCLYLGNKLNLEDDYSYS